MQAARDAGMMKEEDAWDVDGPADDGNPFGSLESEISLMVDAHYPDKTRTKDMELKMERPEYCNRFDSAKARLFPVKDDVANSRRR